MGGKVVEDLETEKAARVKAEKSRQEMNEELKDATLELDTHRSKVLELEKKQRSNWFARKVDEVFGRNPSSKTSKSVAKESKGANDSDENLEEMVGQMSGVQIGKDNITQDQERKEGGDSVEVGTVKTMEDMEKNVFQTIQQ